MSNIATIESVFDQLTALAGQYREAAVGLAKAAADRINGTGKAPDPYLLRQNSETPPDSASYPSPVAVLDRYDPPAIPTLANSPIRTRAFAQTVPGLKVTQTAWIEPQKLAIVAAKAPASLIELRGVAAPALEEIAAPALTPPPESWDIPDISVGFPDLPPPDFEIFDGQTYEEAYRVALALFQPWLDAMPDLDDRIAQIRARLQTALAEAPDLDAYENEKYAQMRHDANLAWRNALEQLDAQPTTPVGLPDGRRILGRTLAEFGWHQASAKAAFDARNARLELELAALTRIRPIQAKLTLLGMDWWARALTLAIGAVDVALDAFDGALAEALELLALEKRKLAAFVRFNEAQARLFEDQRQQVVAHVQKVKLALQGEKLKGQHNANAIRAYEIAIGLLERKQTLYAEQAGYVEADLAARTARLEYFEAEIEQRQTLARLERAEHELRQARIRHDRTAVAYQLRRMDEVVAQIEKDKANTRAALLAIKEQAQHNRNALATYSAEVDGYLTQYRQITEADKLLLEAWLAGHEADEKAKSLEFEQTTLTNAVKLQEALRDLERDRVRVTTELKRRQLRVSRQAAQARVQAGSAGILTGIGKAASSGLNGLVDISNTE